MSVGDKMVQVDETIRKFLADNFLLSDGDFNLADDASLLEEGVVDSTGVLELITFVEDTFQIAVDDEDVTPDNFDSVSKIASYVRSKA